MPDVIITLTTTGHTAVAVATTMTPPKPGAPLSPAEALALDAINTLKRSPHCTGVQYGAALGKDDGDKALQLARDLLNPDGFAYSVTPEVRNAARRVLGVKAREAV